MLQKRGHAKLGGIFMETTLDIGPIPGLSDWRECSSKCLDRNGCKFWQYDTMDCYLFKNFEFIEILYISTDCIAKKAVSNCFGPSRVRPRA